MEIHGEEAQVGRCYKWIMPGDPKAEVNIEEGVWVEFVEDAPRGQGLFRLRNDPAFQDGFKFGDILLLEYDKHRLVLVEKMCGGSD